MAEPTFEIYRDVAGKFRYRLKAPNNEIIVVGRAFDTKEELIETINILRFSVREAETVDTTLEDVLEGVEEIKEYQATLERRPIPPVKGRASSFYRREILVMAIIILIVVLFVYALYCVVKENKELVSLRCRLLCLWC